MVLEAGPLGEARAADVVVLPREQAARERRPDGGAIGEGLVQRRVLDLEAVAVEGVVLGLLGDGGNEVVLLREQRGFGYLLRGPLRRAPVVGQVQVADALGEAFDDFEHGGAVEGVVSEELRWERGGEVRLTHSRDGVRRRCPRNRARGA